MAWSIQDYKQTPASNKAINGIDISDATGLPGDLNDALRQLMADISESGLCHPELYVSGEDNNALVLGEDGLFFADPENIAGGTPALYVSADANNDVSVARDGRLAVLSEDILERPYPSVPEKPASFPATPHATTHGPGGSDVISTFIPAGMIFEWYGGLENIPDGWALCDGTGGTPDMRGLMTLGAGGAVQPNKTGGALNPKVEIWTSGADILGYDTHAHEMQGKTSGLSPNYDPAANRTQLLFHLGYSASTISQNLEATGDARHMHGMTPGARRQPPYIGLFSIMKL